MKRAILTLILCVLAAGASFAQEDADMQASKSLTINAMVQYGQELYNRGDYNQARAVFNHVLTYDNHQAQALEYIKEIGQASAQSLKMVVGDMESLKEAIEAKKKTIEKLRIQIMQMRANLALPSAGE